MTSTRTEPTNIWGTLTDVYRTTKTRISQLAQTALIGVGYYLIATSAALWALMLAAAAHHEESNMTYLFWVIGSALLGTGVTIWIGLAWLRASIHIASTPTTQQPNPPAEEFRIGLKKTWVWALLLTPFSSIPNTEYLATLPTPLLWWNIIPTPVLLWETLVGINVAPLYPILVPGIWWTVLATVKIAENRRFPDAFTRTFGLLNSWPWGVLTTWIIMVLLTAGTIAAHMFTVGTPAPFTQMFTGSVMTHNIPTVLQTLTNSAVTGLWYSVIVVILASFSAAMHKNMVSHHQTHNTHTNPY